MILFASSLSPLLFAALVVAPADRLSMADRLFGRGDFAAAKREYLALKGVSGVDEADVLYRLVAEYFRILSDSFSNVINNVGIV